MGVVDASRYAEAEAGVTLREIKRRIFPPRANACCQPSLNASLGHRSPYSISHPPGCPAQGDAGRRRGWRSSAECSAQQRGALNRWRGRVGAAEDLPHHRVSTERLGRAGSWAKRRWSLAEKASPCWLLPRKGHRCHSRDCASQQRPTPAPLHPGMWPWHRDKLATINADSKIYRFGWRWLSGWSGPFSSVSFSSQTRLEHHLSFSC